MFIVAALNQNGGCDSRPSYCSSVSAHSCSSCAQPSAQGGAPYLKPLLELPCSGLSCPHHSLPKVQRGQTGFTPESELQNCSRGHSQTSEFKAFSHSGFDNASSWFSLWKHHARSCLAVLSPLLSPVCLLYPTPAQLWDVDPCRQLRLLSCSGSIFLLT